MFNQSTLAVQTPRINALVEASSCRIFEKLLEPVFLVKRTYEGCKSDAIVKPYGCTENKWLHVQLKGSVFNKRNVARFRHMSGYDHMTMVCIGLNSVSEHDDEQHAMWVFNGDECSKVQGVSINKNTSGKYAKYQIKNQEDFVTTIMNCYESISFLKSEEEKAMVPIAESCKKEHEYRMKRIKRLGRLLDIVYPKEANKVYDCVINGAKVQDKLGRKHRFGMKFCLTKIANMKKCPYHKDDNDFYWFHLPADYDDEHFYVIPSWELEQRGYLKSESYPGKQSIVLFPKPSTFPNTKSWTNKYKYSYNKNIDTRRLALILHNRERN